MIEWLNDNWILSVLFHHFHATSFRIPFIIQRLIQLRYFFCILLLLLPFFRSCSSTLCKWFDDAMTILNMVNYSLEDRLEYFYFGHCRNGKHAIPIFWCYSDTFRRWSEFENWSIGSCYSWSVCARWRVLLSMRSPAVLRPDLNLYFRLVWSREAKGHWISNERNSNATKIYVYCRIKNHSRWLNTKHTAETICLQFNCTDSMVCSKTKFTLLEIVTVIKANLYLCTLNATKYNESISKRSIERI